MTTRKAGVVARFMASLKLGNPQTRTMSDKTAKGIQALAIWRVVKCLTESRASAALMDGSSAKRQILLGCQTRRKSSAASRETRSEEHTSELQSHHDLVC